jgi:hypothetical protein
MEWLTEPVPALARNGLPGKKLECTDDDPNCDFGAFPGDNACTFRIAMCLNVAEPRFGCSPTDIATALVRGRADGDQDALEESLTDLGGEARPTCARGPLRGQPCVVNGDCDSVPGKGNGWCRRVVVFSPPFTTRNVCTDFAEIVVPLRQTRTGLLRKGVKIIGLQVTPSRNPVTGKRRAADSNFLKLTCYPQP